MNIEPRTGIRHPAHGGGEFANLSCDRDMMAETDVYMRKLALQNTYWQKMVDPKPANECENIFEVKSPNVQKLPSQDITMNKDMRDKAVWIKPGVSDKKNLGRPRGITMKMKNCDYRTSMGKKAWMDAIKQWTYDQLQIEQKRLCINAHAAVPKSNKGWSAGVRDGCIQLGTKGNPIFWTPEFSKAIAMQPLHALRQHGFDPDGISSDALYVKGPSQLQLALQLPGAHTNYDVNGMDRPGPNVLSGCGVPDMFGCFNICPWDEPVQCTISMEGGKKVPVYRLLFGVRKHNDEKSIHAIQSMKSLIIPPQMRMNIFADYWEFQAMIDMDSCPAEPNYLVEMWLAIPKVNLKLTGTPAGV